MTGLVQRGLAALALAAALFASVAPVHAQSIPEGTPRLAVIDTERIMLSSKVGKAAVAALGAFQAQKEGELRAAHAAVQDLQAKAAAARATATPEQQAAAQKEIGEKAAAYERAHAEATRAIASKRDQVLADIDAKVMPIITRLAERERYSMVFRKFESGLIFVDAAYDVTNLVLRELDAATP